MDRVDGGEVRADRGARVSSLTENPKNDRWFPLKQEEGTDVCAELNEPFSIVDRSQFQTRRPISYAIFNRKPRIDSLNMVCVEAR
jgi:hypothetical protein